jgi:hypothetical protein
MAAASISLYARAAFNCRRVILLRHATYTYCFFFLLLLFLHSFMR